MSVRGAGCWCASFLEEDSLHSLLKTTTYTTLFPSAPAPSLFTQNGALQDGLQVKTKTKPLGPVTEFRVPYAGGAYLFNDWQHPTVVNTDSTL